MINIMANEYMFSLSQWFIANKLGPTKSRPEPSGAVRNRPDTVRTVPDGSGRLLVGPNKFSLNIDQTCFITLANHNAQNPVILINDFKIADVDYCKYLGLYVVQDLKWTIHIDQLCGKLQKLAGIFLQNQE